MKVTGEPIRVTDFPQIIDMSSPEMKFREAFAKAKKAFKPVIATEDNPFFHSKYASLATYHHAVDEALLANGFTLHQVFDADTTGNYLITKLCHLGGFTEVSKIRILSKDDSDPQKMGSAVTYFRRYALAAILGIPVEDDDGNTAAKTDTQGGSNVSGKEFRFKFGKYNGKSFAEIPIKELISYIQWLSQKDHDKNEHIIDAFKQWNKDEIKKELAEDTPPISDDEIPDWVK
jgi:hypothetical protein